METVITSTRNRRIVELRKLHLRKHRRAQQRFMVEGLQLIGMALEAGHTPLEVFFCPDHFAGPTAPAMLAGLKEAGGQLFQVSAAVMESLSERDAPQGIVATFPTFEASLERVLARTVAPALLVVVDRLQDPGNLGTIIRTADAVAAAGVVLLEPCVDPFEPKTVRGSMGSLFNLPLLFNDRPEALLATLRAAGYRLTGADGYRGDRPWAAESKALTGSVALVLGNEARGLSDDLRPELTDWVRLPMPGRAESLNVAVAGAVLMYQWLQRNQSAT